MGWGRERKRGGGRERKRISARSYLKNNVKTKGPVVWLK
jgi:hypothetical protein